MECYRCGRMNIEFRKTIMQSGATAIGAYCLDCNARATEKTWLSKTLFSPEMISLMPIEQNYVDKELACCVEGCAANGVEWHHFAPRHAFGRDADKWPAGWLCPMHHQEWHMKTRTGPYRPHGDGNEPLS